MNKETKDTYRFWQDKRINQLGTTNNLILTFSLGALYFILDLYKGIELKYCIHNLIFIIALIALFISLLSAILLNLNRLKDYRETSQIVRKRDNENVDDLRNDNKKTGEKTWSLLNWQLWSFFTGIALTSILYIIIQIV